MKNKFSFLWWTGCSFSWWYVIWVGGLFWQTLSKETNVFNGMRPMDVGDHLRGVTSDQVVGENLSAYCHPSVDKHGVKSSVPRSRQHLAQNKSITMRCLLWQSSFFFLRFTSFCIIQRVCAIDLSGLYLSMSATISLSFPISNQRGQHGKCLQTNLCFKKALEK